MSMHRPTTTVSRVLESDESAHDLNLRHLQIEAKEDRRANSNYPLIERHRYRAVETSL